MDFQKKRLEQLGVESLGSFKGNAGAVRDEKSLVYGPKEFDNLFYGWSRGELMGILGDSSSGKTEVVLMSMADILRNNPDSYAVFVSLEMKTDRLANRFLDMVKDDIDISDRFLVISRYDKDGKSKDISMKSIKSELLKVREAVGDVVTFCIDHLHAVGENDVSSLNSICLTVKEMCVELDAFGMLLGQVSKGHGKGGEVPLTADAVYSASQYKWVCSDILQIHRPIKRYEDEAKLSVMGYSYVKIREPHKDDKLKVGQNKLLKYDLEKRSLVKMDINDYTNFKMYYSAVLEAREKEEKKTAHEYDLSKEITTKEGKVITINERFSGEVEL